MQFVEHGLGAVAELRTREQQELAIEVGIGERVCRVPLRHVDALLELASVGEPDAHDRLLLADAGLGHHVDTAQQRLDRDPLGRRIRNIPDTMSNLLLNYRIRSGTFKNLSAFVGVSHVGEVAGETRSGVTPLGVPQQPGFFIAPWTVVNAGAGYTYGRYRLSLNVDNLLDQKFWWQPASRISVSPYPGLTVRLTTSVRF